MLVKTGKYLPRTHRAAAGSPDHVLDSSAAVRPAPGVGGGSFARAGPRLIRPEDG